MFPKLEQALRTGELLFKTKSDLFRDERYVDVGDNSPLKDEASLKCFLTRAIPFTIDGSNKQSGIQYIYLYI